MGSNTKIYTVFVSSGIQHFEAQHIETATNEYIINKIREKCSDMDFIIGSDMHNTGNIKNNFDGVLIFGDLFGKYSAAMTGLPTIVVYMFPEFLHIPFELFKNRGNVLTASFDRAQCCSSSVSSAMFDDLIKKIKLIQAVKELKESKILVVTDGAIADFFNRGDIHSTYKGDIRQRNDRDRVLMDAVTYSLGAEMVKIGTEEVVSDDEIQRIWESSGHKEAGETAGAWMNEAREINGTIKEEVVKSAKLYIIMKLLMQKYNASAMAYHLRHVKENEGPEGMVWPSLGNSEFQKNGIVGCCQAHTNVILSHMVAQYAFGKSSMMGDFIMDTVNDVSIVMHCGGPWNPRGKDDRISYVLRDHAERKVKEHAVPGCGACSEVIYPEGEDITIWRFDVLNKQIVLHTGRTVDGYSLYKDWDYLMCRTKIVAETNTEEVRKYIYPDKRGVHRTATFGDYREQIKNFAVLTGFEVIEEDR